MGRRESKNPYATKLDHITQRYIEVKEKRQKAKLEQIKNPGQKAEKDLSDLRLEFTKVEHDLDDLANEVRADTATLRRAIEEAQRLLYDWHKHISTLSVATIAGLVTLLRLENLNGTAREDVTSASMFLLAAVLLSIFSMLIIAMQILDKSIGRYRKTTSETGGSSTRWTAQILHWAYFLVGAASAGTFVYGVMSAVRVVASGF